MFLCENGNGFEERRGENSFLLCCMVVHMFRIFYNSELKDHNP